MAAALLAALVLAPSTVAAQSPSSSELERDVADAERERQDREGDHAAVVDDLEVAERELADIGSRLDDARGRLRSAEGQVALATGALEEAETERDATRETHEAADALLEELDDELSTESEVLADQVVQTFKYGSSGANRGAAMVEAFRGTEDPSTFAVVLRQLRTVVEDQDTVLDTVATLRTERDELEREAARARGIAMQASIEAADTLEVVESLRDEAADVADEIAHEEARKDALLASLRLSEEEAAALVERAAVRQADLEEQLQAARAEERRQEEARRRAEDEARRRAADRSADAPSGASGGPTVGGLVCPVVGAVAGRDFSNDWGYPRSGGRTHQGNDIFAARGTPVVAVADAEVVRWDPPSSPTRLGGITVTYRTADGSDWYNAHLDTIAPGIAPGASVARGQAIGTVGNTGNAISTPPHLHLGRRHAGGWVNPWPTISEVCR